MRFVDLLLSSLPCLLFFLLAGAARFSWIVGLLERPLSLAIIMGWACNSWEVALPLGISLELFWMDSVAMGGIIQPFSELAFFIAYPICAFFGWTQAGDAIIPLMLAIPTAYLGSALELRFRIANNALTDIDAGGKRKPSPEAMVFGCIAKRTALHALMYIACFPVVAGASWLLHALGAFSSLENLSWPIVYVFAMIGAVLSLRTKRAYFVFSCGVLVVTLFAILF